MPNYANTSGRSGVVAYEEGDDSITVSFRDGSSYLYTYQSAGQANVEHMKSLAHGGNGLNAFINRNVKYSYERKVK